MYFILHIAYKYFFCMSIIKTMASLIFQHSKSIVNKAKKLAKVAASHAERMDLDYRTCYDQVYKMNIDLSFKEFDELLAVSKSLHERYLQNTHTHPCYFITIRPDDTRVLFIDFKQKIEEYLKKPCFVDFVLSYEQKGESMETLGQGFHCHIVATCKQRSKGELLRNTLSFFKSWIVEEKIASNCIQVDATKDGQKLIQNYLIDYKSEDGHKEATKKYDEIWREKNSLDHL